MSELWRIEQVLELVEGDVDLIEQLYASGICKKRVEGFLPEEVEAARVAYTLVRELEVNWPGVEIILRLRQELLETRRQVADLLETARRARRAAVD